MRWHYSASDDHVCCGAVVTDTTDMPIVMVVVWCHSKSHVIATNVWVTYFIVVSSKLDSSMTPLK